MISEIDLRSLKVFSPSGRTASTPLTASSGKKLALGVAHARIVAATFRAGELSLSGVPENHRGFRWTGDPVQREYRSIELLMHCKLTIRAKKAEYSNR
jgi:hypothetical protein